MFSRFLFEIEHWESASARDANLVNTGVAAQHQKRGWPAPGDASQSG